MRVVLDTNVIVAGLLSPYGTCGELVRMVTSGELTLALDARILAEYADVLGRPKFEFDADKVAALLDYAIFRGLMVASNPLRSRLPDPDDEPFLAVALSGRAKYLVTGNLVHYPTVNRQGMEVVSPAEFLRAFRDRPQPA